MSVKDVYDYTDKLKNQLIKDKKVLEISKEFLKITENAERMKFVEKLLIEYRLMAEDMKVKSCKSNATSELHRKKGNEFYTEKKFLDAMESYNKSLCFAESGSDNIGIAYANRSAVYFETQLYSKCLENIQLAKDNNYPMKNMGKLDKRKNLCLELIKTDHDAKNANDPVRGKYFKLNQKLNKKLPFLAECLEVKSNDTFGRYIVTKKALAPGDIVCIEEPFSTFLLPNCSYKYCANCLNDNSLDLIACQQCTSTLFCSDDCAKIGYEKFHKYECGIIDELNFLGTKILRLALRTFFEAFYVCNQNLNELKALMKENEGSTATIFDFDDPFDKKNILQAIDALAMNSGRDQSDLFQRSGIVAIMCNLYLKFTPLKDILPTEADEDFFRCFIFKQTQIAACNYHGLYNGVVKLMEICDDPGYGSGSFPFCSLINHSCAPNLVRLNLGPKNFIVINRPIPAGGQLFDNYGFHHCLETFEQRQLGLLNQYRFKCSCEACEGKFALYNDLSHVDRNFYDIYGGDIEKLMHFDFERAIEKFESYCLYLKKYDKYYPCYEISSLQECLLQALKMFSSSKSKMQLCIR
ncbi:CLUMA_CG019079, isoform A [Clunio marinus]|uniref:CLUMA_CG019079, isoform A n=1 Tax=Clunio marinus TaxID=568069 RepID=A0A1J1J2D0_9DIPT|nr:CLUMA_CG019079, isoform A [Clunio marinus]